MLDKRDRSPRAVAGPASKAIVTSVILLVAALPNEHSFAEDQSRSTSLPPWCSGGRCSNPDLVHPIDLSLCAPGAGGIWCPSTAPQAIYVLTPEEFQLLQNAKHPSQAELDEAKKALVDNKSK